MGWFAIIIGKMLNFWQGLHWNNQFFFTKHWEESRTVKEWYSKAAQSIADKARGECSDRRGKVRGELPLHVLISFYLSFWMPRKINVSNVRKQAVQKHPLWPLHVSFWCSWLCELSPIWQIKAWAIHPSGNEAQSWTPGWQQQHTSHEIYVGCEG